MFEVEVNTDGLTRFASNRMKVATNKALDAVGRDYAKRVLAGFKAEGVDPRSGRTGYWPKLKIPSGPTKKGGRTSRGKILKKSGKYLQAVGQPSIVLRSKQGGAGVQTAFRNLPAYAQYHEQQGNAVGYTQQKASAKQAAFLRYLGFRGVHEGSIITLPARRVFVYPPTWRAASKRLFQRVFKEAIQ